MEETGIKHLNQIIGDNLYRIRKERDLSLDQFSELTGVSKSMLRQIERGESSPTITTVVKIATNLHLPLSALIHEDNHAFTLIAKKELLPLSENPTHYRIFELFPFDPAKKFEIFVIEMDGECAKDSEAHDKGVEEYLMVLKGCLTMTIGPDVYDIPAGNAIHYAANQPHAVQNRTNALTEFIDIIYYS